MQRKIVLVGQGASGKDVLVNFLIERGLKKVVSYTTRPIRNNEKNGESYNFITEAEYLMLERSNFFRYSETYIDFHYGVSYESIKNSNLFIMTPSMVKALTKEERSEYYIIYLCIDEKIRKDRLKKRKDFDDVLRRLKADKKDFKYFRNYDLKIRDENFECEDVLRAIKINMQ